MNNPYIKTKNKGFTLLLSVLISGIVLAVGLSLLSVALKQFKISSIGLNSEVAFQAANAGVECVKYWDLSSVDGGSFDVPGNGTPSPGGRTDITCMGGTETACVTNPAGNGCNNAGARSGEEQEFEFIWTNGGIDICTNVSVWKFFDVSSDQPMASAGVNRDCPTGVECTVIHSRGYNRDCNQLNSLKTVERELFVRY